MTSSGDTISDTRKSHGDEMASPYSGKTTAGAGVREDSRKCRELLDAVADCLHSVSAGDLPQVCLELGLATGTGDEAFSSKRKYVGRRTSGFTLQQARNLAANTLLRYDDPRLALLLDESQPVSDRSVSEVTRRAILKELNGVPDLFGDAHVEDCLNLFAREVIRLSETELPGIRFLSPLSSHVLRHFVRNDDISVEQLLIDCGALTCNQNRLFRFLERVLDPTIRTGDAQATLATAINRHLLRDGYKALVTSHVSGYPAYSIAIANSSAGGPVKNLIFASVKLKPDLYLKDAVSNDVAIVNSTDALIFDAPLSSEGLTWKELVAWWARANPTSTADTARNLYLRLRESVLASGSPGEVAIFQTYYDHYSKSDQVDFPALVPQVYLHYDPKSSIFRGEQRPLSRQRMDFLMLLPFNTRVVIEVDGKHHYCDGDRGSPRKYAAMVSEDRRLRLNGYHLYRFGAEEFQDTDLGKPASSRIGPQSRELVVQFFEQLLRGLSR